MHKKTQKQRIVCKLKRDGKVSRNECLATFPAITRLSAIILSLKKENYDFDTKDDGKDYTYTWKNKPPKIVGEIVEKDGQLVYQTKIIKE